MKNNLKILSAVILLSLSQNIFAQQNVGIMTSQPQEKLHVAGNSSILDDNIGSTGIALIAPTVRINGLNRTNNPSVFTAADTTAPLYTNSNGDTTVKKGLEAPAYTLPGDDAITSNATLNVPGNGTYVSTANLLSTSFTLNQRSVVYISSSLSADVLNSSGGVLSDGKDRIVAAALTFTSAPASSGVDTSSTYVLDEFVFANRSTSSVNSSFKLNPTCELVLPAGTYTIALTGRAAASEATADAFRIIFGSGSGDKLNVFTRPL